MIRLEPGVQRPRRRSDWRSGSCRDSAWLLVQVFRHLGLAARFVSGYLIQLKRRREAARRPGGPARPTSPTCTPGPRSTCRAPAGSGSTRRRGCSPARGTSRSPARPTRRAPRRSPGRSPGRRTRRRADETCVPEFDFEMSVTRDPRRPAGHEAVHATTQWREIDAPRPRGSTSGCEAGDVRLTMGGEPTFVSVDDREGAEWNTAGAGPDEAGARRPAARRGSATGSRRAGLLHSRAGQVVSGRVAAALGALVLLAARRRPDLGRPRLWSPTRPATMGTARSKPGASRASWPAGSGVDPDVLHAGLRGRLVLPLERAAAAVERRPAQEQPRRPRGA